MIQSEATWLALILSTRRELALLVGFAWHVSACSCTEATCGDGVGIHGPIDIATTGPARIWIRACRNGTCGEVALSSDALVPPYNSVNAGIDLGDGAFRCRLVNFDGQARWDLTVLFAPRDTELANGDQYDLHVVDTDTQHDLVMLSQSVDYREEKPNAGPFCGPTCQVATVDIPPSW